MDDKELLEENRIIHYLISELNDAADEVAQEWENWSILVDQQRVSRILREMFTGMLVAEGKCTELHSTRYINNKIKEHKKMKTSKIKAGSKQRIKIGKNEVEVTVVKQTAKGWIVEAKSGKRFPVNDESRFMKKEKEIKTKSVEEPKVVVPPKSKMSMLDAAVEVLKDASRPMSAKEMIAAMEKANLWKSPNGSTPWNSLVSAIAREISKKENPRFRKAAPGKFELAERSQ